MKEGILLLGGLALVLLVVGRREQPRPAYQPRINPRLPAPGRRAQPAVVLPSDAIERDADDRLGRLDELLALYFAIGTTPGTFCLVDPDATPETIARAALASVGPFTESQVLDYVYCFTSSPWNLALYGGPSTSKRYPRRWIIPGFGQGVRAAFLPRNADALEMMANGVIPPRAVDESTAKALTESVSYGLLGLPPICPEQRALGVVTCAPFSWDDGSSTIDPDPEFIGLLEMAA